MASSGATQTLDCVNVIAGRMAHRNGQVEAFDFQ